MLTLKAHDRLGAYPVVLEAYAQHRDFPFRHRPELLVARVRAFKEPCVVATHVIRAQHQHGVVVGLQEPVEVGFPRNHVLRRPMLIE